MRPAVVTFATDVARAIDAPGPILQIGSRVAAGEETLFDPADVFTARPHFGFDIQPGPRVDCVGDAHRLPFPDESVRTGLGFETPEHVAEPPRVLQEPYRGVTPCGPSV